MNPPFDSHKNLLFWKICFGTDRDLWYGCVCWGKLKSFWWIIKSFWCFPEILSRVYKKNKSHQRQHQEQHEMPFKKSINRICDIPFQREASINVHNIAFQFDVEPLDVGILSKLPWIGTFCALKGPVKTPQLKETQYI